MHLFGLTGGIASGKSTVAALLSARGVPVIDADELAREVVSPQSEGWREVVAAFGAGVVRPDGSLDRKALGAIVFDDPAARRTLNAITHPRIAALTRDRAAALAQAGEPLAAYEAALLVENGVADAFRPLVVCACPEDVQIARLRARDGSTLDEALARLRAQRPLAEKIAVADQVIDTGGSLDATAQRTAAALHAVCLGLNLDPARYGV